MLGMSIEQLILIGLQSQHSIKLLMVRVWVPMTRSASFCQGYLIHVHLSALGMRCVNCSGIH